MHHIIVAAFRAIIVLALAYVLFKWRRGDWPPRNGGDGGRYA